MYTYMYMYNVHMYLAAGGPWTAAWAVLLFLFCGPSVSCSCSAGADITICVPSELAEFGETGRDPLPSEGWVSIFCVTDAKRSKLSRLIGWLVSSFLLFEESELSRPNGLAGWLESRARISLVFEGASDVELSFEEESFLRRYFRLTGGSVSDDVLFRGLSLSLCLEECFCSWIFWSWMRGLEIVSPFTAESKSVGWADWVDTAVVAGWEDPAPPTVVEGGPGVCLRRLCFFFSLICMVSRNDSTCNNDRCFHEMCMHFQLHRMSVHAVNFHHKSNQSVACRPRIKVVLQRKLKSIMRFIINWIHIKLATIDPCGLCFTHGRLTDVQHRSRYICINISEIDNVSGANPWIIAIFGSTGKDAPCVL